MGLMFFCITILLYNRCVHIKGLSIYPILNNKNWTIENARKKVQKKKFEKKKNFGRFFNSFFFFLSIDHLREYNNTRFHSPSAHQLIFQTHSGLFGAFFYD